MLRPPLGVFGVGQPLSHKKQSLPDMRRTDARSAKIGRPNGVTLVFHFSVYKVEPAEASFACNLFAKDDWRAALADEIVPCRPQVPLVVESFALPGGAEWLAGA